MGTREVQLTQQLKEAEKCLSGPPIPDDELLYVLDQTEKLLAKVDQSPNDLMQEVLRPLIRALVKGSLLEHSNTDVKVSVASCFSEITRITAPEAPYDDNEMKDVFRLIVSSFENLSDKSSRSYGKRVSILESVSRVRSWVIMIDLECEDLIVEMFEHFLKSVRDYHLDNIFSSMVDIMTLVIEERDDVSLDMLKPLLFSIKNDNGGVLPVARKLGEEVLQKSRVKLRPYLIKALTILDDSLDNYSQTLTSICEETTHFEHNDESASVQQQTDESKLVKKSEESPQADESMITTISSADMGSSKKPEEAIDATSQRTLKIVMSNGGKTAGNEEVPGMPCRVRARVEPTVDEHEVPRQPEDPAVPRVVHPGDEALHPFLQFTDEVDRRDRDALLARAAVHGFAPMRHLSWDSLRSLDLSERVEDLCGPHWRALFSISESVSDILAIEFFSTFHMLTPLPDFHTDSAITFRLGGVERRLSLRQFAVHLGLYREDELDTPAFTEGIIDFPTGMTPQHAWADLGSVPYSLPNPKSTSFRDPLIRILHRVIAHGISGRGDSGVGNVMHFDLLYLHCMVNHVPCQIAERLARYLFQVRRQKYTQAIFGGGYVLRLAGALGVAAPIQPPAPRFVASPRAIDMTVLVSMGLVRRQGRGFVLREQPAAPQVQPREHDGEAGLSGTAGDAGGSGIGGSDQVRTSSEIPDSSIPVPPPTHTAPPPQPERVYERGYGARLRRLERIQALEFARAEAHRSLVTRALQALAAAAVPGFVIPDLPAPLQELADFIREAGPTPTPDPEQPPPAP